jgi:hypothetical protein
LSRVIVSSVFASPGLAGEPHAGPHPSLPLLKGFGCLDVKLAFVLRFGHDIGALKGLRDIAATFSVKAFQIQGALALFVDLNRYGLLLHGS